MSSSNKVSKAQQQDDRAYKRTIGGSLKLKGGESVTTTKKKRRKLITTSTSTSTGSSKLSSDEKESKETTTQLIGVLSGEEAEAVTLKTTVTQVKSEFGVNSDDANEEKNEDKNEQGGCRVKKEGKKQQTNKYFLADVDEYQTCTDSC